jgi:hypothetical protein
MEKAPGLADKLHQFDEQKHEDIINSVYHKFVEPEKYQDSIESDMAQYIVADKSLDLETEQNINPDFVQNYSEFLNNYNSPDTIATIIWLLPKVKIQVSEKLNSLQNLTVKVRTGEDVGMTNEDLLNQIKYYSDIQSQINEFEIDLNKPNEDKADFVDTDTASIELDNLGDDKNTINIDADDEQEPKSIEEEKTPHEKFEDYLFKKGINKIVIHGGLVEYKKDAEKQALMPRVDFDADSALMVLDEVGAKYATGATTTWIHPEAVLKQDKSGRYYYEYNKEKTFLTKGTLVIDVGKSNGFNVLDGDIFTIDYHAVDAVDADEDTSATQILVENLEQLNRYTDGTEKFPEYLNSYAKLVSKIDNLSMDTEMDIDFKENYAKTMYALQPFLYSKNRKILLEIFKKYPDISLDGFTDEELEYPIGVREYTSINDRRIGFRGVKIYSEIPNDFNLDYIYEDFTIQDIVENQQKAVEYSIDEINLQAQRMFRDKLKINSPITGKTLFVDQETKEYTSKDGTVKKFNTYSKNSFGAVTAYKMGYDTMIIFNRDKGNQIFVSSKNKEGLHKFAQNLEMYYPGAVIVRDKMLILRDKSMKSVNPVKIREAVIKSSEIGGFNEKEYLKELDEYIEYLKKTYY